MKKIIIISLLLSLCTYPPLSAAVLTDAQIGTRIDSIQANVPAGVPSTPTGMDQKGFIGEMLANIFNTQNKIKGFFIEAFVSIWNSQANTLPRWNGQSFIAGTIRDDGTNIAIGTGIVNNTRVNIAGNINISGEYYQDGVLFIPDIPTDVVRTFGAQDIGGIKTFLSAMVFENTSPVLNFIDTDTSAQSYITANSISGSIAIVADRSNIISGSRIMFAVDNTIPKMVILESGNVGIGVSDPSDELDVNGKIRMRSQTLATDSPDIVATKKYVDDMTNDTEDKLEGYREISVNFNEDTYGTATNDVSRTPRSEDTCNSDSLTAYVCSINDNKSCRDEYTYTTTATVRRGDSDYQETTRWYVSKPIICIKTNIMVRTEGDDQGIKISDTGTARIIGRNYSGTKEGCTVSINIPARDGNPSCIEDHTFRLGSQGSDGECERTIESAIQSESICTNFKGVKSVNWNRSGDTGSVRIEYFGF